MRKNLEFLKKPQVKNVVLGVLTIAIGAICSALGSWNNFDKIFWIKLSIAVGLTILYCIALVFYSTNEVNERRIMKILEDRIGSYESVMVGLIAVCRQSAIDVTSVIHTVKENGNVDLNIWNFDKACTWVCSQIYILLGCLSGGNKDFGIAYIKLEEENKPEIEIRMNAFANQNMHKPSIYGRKRRIDNDNDRNYHDIDLFRLGKSDIDVIIGKDNINEAFSYENKGTRKKNKDKYNQYIAIPVICNDKKMVGLLEVVCLNNASLGNNEEEIKEVASKFLVPYSYLILLLHKLEKALLAKPVEDVVKK